MKVLIGATDDDTPVQQAKARRPLAELSHRVLAMALLVSRAAGTTMTGSDLPTLSLQLVSVWVRSRPTTAP